MQEDAFEKLCPPWEKVKVIKRIGNLPNVSLPEEVFLETYLGPLKSTWHLKHVDFISGHEFSDQLISGPFKYYKHRHLMREINDNQSELIDEINFELPFALISGIFIYPLIKAKFDKLFAFRHSVTKLIESDFD